MQTEDFIFIAKILAFLLSGVLLYFSYFSKIPHTLHWQISKQQVNIFRYREDGALFHVLLWIGYFCWLNVLFDGSQKGVSAVVFVVSLLMHASRFFKTHICIDLQHQRVRVVFDRIILKTKEDYSLAELVAVNLSREQRFQDDQYSKVGGLRWVLKLRFDLLDELRDIEIFTASDDYSAGQALFALKSYFDNLQPNQVAFVYTQDDFHHVHPLGEFDEKIWQHKLLIPFVGECQPVIHQCEFQP